MVTLYDDTYEGPRWRYGLTYRPLAHGAVPDGWIVFSDRPHPDFRFGTLDWPHRLSESVASHLDLTELGRVEAS